MTIEGKFQWKKQEVVPAFLQGKDALEIYNAIKDLGLGWMNYDAETQTLRGSNPFIAARIDALLRPLGIRVADLRDLSRPEVMEMTRGLFYADTPRFALRTMNDSHKRNLPLIKRTAEEVEKKYGKLNLPLIISGFDAVPWPEDKKGYGVNIVPRDDFTAVYDERLNGKNNGRKFSKADEFGLPIFDEKGSRTFYARNEGLSGFCLNRNSGMGSIDRNLADSYGVGRVVVVKSGEADAKK